MAPRTAILAMTLAALACGPDPTPEPGETDPVVAWQAFCDRLEAAGVEILREHPQGHRLDRAESTRYLAQQVANAVQSTLIDEQTAFPMLRLGATTIDKWGLDGADAKYTTARVEGGGDYRLSGRLGSAKLTAIQLFTMHPDYEPFAFLSNDALDASEDGRFELRIAAERPAAWAGPWLPLDERATTLLIREYFDDWERELPSQLRLERLDGGGETGRAEDPGALLGKIADAFAHRAPMWLGRSKQVSSFVVNDFFAITPEENSQGLAENVYGSGWFRIGPDEALVIELEAPEALLWSFQLGNYWWESLDYVNRTGSINGHQAAPSSDGRYRLVVSLEDPGVPNWLDPDGHREGMMLYRYQRARTSPEPQLTIVPVAQLAAHLPADTARITPAQRSAEVAKRRRHASRRWAP